MKCQCEQTVCEHHNNQGEYSPCQRDASVPIATPYGAFQMCLLCGSEMVAYLKAERRQIDPSLCVVNGQEAHKHFPVEDY